MHAKVLHLVYVCMFRNKEAKVAEVERETK